MLFDIFARAIGRALACKSFPLGRYLALWNGSSISCGERRISSFWYQTCQVVAVFGHHHQMHFIHARIFKVEKATSMQMRSHWLNICTAPDGRWIEVYTTGMSQSAHQSTERHSVTAVIGRSIRFSMCRSDALISANDPSAAQRLQLGTLCLLLSSTVTLSLCLNLD